MIRSAKFGDVPGMIEVLREGHAASFYAGIATFDEREANRLLVNVIQRHNGRGEAGTWVQVIEKDGKVEGFIVGVLQRVYFIAEQCSATDLMWISTKRAGVRDKVKLMWTLTEWAKARKNVVEVVCGVSGAFPAERAGAERILAALGFQPWGGFWRMDVSGASAVEGVAA